MSYEYTPQELAKKAATTKLNASVKQGVPAEVAFIRYLARLDKAGCPLLIPVGWYVDNMPAGSFEPCPPSGWSKVIESFRAHKRGNPPWLAKIHEEVAREDRADRMDAIIGCAPMLLVAAFLAWWLIPGVRSLVQRLLH